jgi:hypothetical protein
MVTLTYGYCCDMFQVAHYTMDMASNIYNRYGTELCNGYSLNLMVDVMLMGWLIHEIE